MVRASLDKLGVDSSSVRLVPIPFPAMRTALANGQVDAAHMPEPFMSQTLNLDNGRIVLAPGPAIMPFLPNGVYVARGAWARENPALARQFRLAMNEALLFSQSNPAEVRALLPAAIRDIRLAVWSPVLDRKKLLQLAVLARRYEIISRLPDMTKLVPGTIATGVILKGDVGAGQDRAQAGQVAGQGAGCRYGHGRRLRPVDEAELPPQGARRRQEDRRCERPAGSRGRCDSGWVGTRTHLTPTRS